MSASHAWAWSQKAAAKETKESPCLFRHKWDDSNLLLSLGIPKVCIHYNRFQELDLLESSRINKGFESNLCVLPRGSLETELDNSDKMKQPT